MILDFLKLNIFFSVNFIVYFEERSLDYYFVCGKEYKSLFIFSVCYFCVYKYGNYVNLIVKKVNYFLNLL